MRLLAAWVMIAAATPCCTEYCGCSRGTENCREDCVAGDACGNVHDCIDKEICRACEGHDNGPCDCSCYPLNSRGQPVYYCGPDWTDQRCDAGDSCDHSVPYCYDGNNDNYGCDRNGDEAGPCCSGGSPPPGYPQANKDGNPIPFGIPCFILWIVSGVATAKANRTLKEQLAAAKTKEQLAAAHELKAKYSKYLCNVFLVCCLAHAVTMSLGALSLPQHQHWFIHVMTGLCVLLGVIVPIVGCKKRDEILEEGEGDMKADVSAVQGFAEFARIINVERWEFGCLPKLQEFLARTGATTPDEVKKYGYAREFFATFEADLQMIPRAKAMDFLHITGSGPTLESEANTQIGPDGMPIVVDTVYGTPSAVPGSAV
jgi:hypothetical protein